MTVLDRMRDESIAVYCETSAESNLLFKIFKNHQVRIEVDEHAPSYDVFYVRLGDSLVVTTDVEALSCCGYNIMMFDYFVYQYIVDYGNEV